MLNTRYVLVEEARAAYEEQVADTVTAIDVHAAEAAQVVLAAQTAKAVAGDPTGCVGFGI